MSKKIPSIQFKSSYQKIDGIEIISIKDIFSRAGTDHNPQKPHQVTFYGLFLYTSGTSEHLIDFELYPVEKNTLFYVSKGQVNAFTYKEGIEGYAILFTQEYLEKQFKSLPESIIYRLFASQLFSPKITIPEHQNLVSYVELIFHEFYKEDHYNKQNIINALFTVILSKAEQLRKQQSVHLEESDQLLVFVKFENLVQQYYTQHRNANFYASKLGITYKHLNVICKKINRKTAKKCIDDFIILEAKRNLINSNIKSTELAFSLGFTESTNFVKFFKKHTQLTPNQFKNKHI